MAKFYLRRRCAVILSLLLLGTSCGDMDLFDSDKWSETVDWQPNLVVPVAHGTFTMWDLINQGNSDTSYIQQGDDKVLFVKYVENNIASIPVSDVFKLENPNVNFPVVSVDIPHGFMPADRIFNSATSQEIEFPDECVVRELNVEGKLKYDLPANFNYQVELIFQNVLLDGVTKYKITENVRHGHEVHKEIVLPNTTLIKLDADQKVKLDVIITVREGENVIAGGLDMSFLLKDLSFICAKGKIKGTPVEIPKGVFALDNIDFLNEIGGDFRFAEPELNLIVRNIGVGIPVELDMAFTSYDKNVPLNLIMNPGKRIVFKGNSTETEKIEINGYNKDNCNLVDVLSSTPDSMVYHGNVLINPNDELNNVIYSSGKISMDAEVKIPLKLSANELTYRDTIADINLSDAENLVSGRIRLIAENGIPLELEIAELILLDNNGNRLGVVTSGSDKKNMLAAGMENGDTTHGELIFSLTKDNIAQLVKAENILLEVKANTSNNSVVTIKGDAKLAFKLIIEAQTDMKNMDI